MKTTPVDKRKVLSVISLADSKIHIVPSTFRYSLLRFRQLSAVPYVRTSETGRNKAGRRLRNTIQCDKLSVTLDVCGSKHTFATKQLIHHHIPRRNPLVKSVEGVFARFAFVARFEWTSNLYTNYAERVDTFVGWRGDMGQVKSRSAVRRCEVSSYNMLNVSMGQSVYCNILAGEIFTEVYMN